MFLVGLDDDPACDGGGIGEVWGERDLILRRGLVAAADASLSRAARASLRDARPALRSAGGCI